MFSLALQTLQVLPSVEQTAIIVGSTSTALFTVAGKDGETATVHLDQGVCRVRVLLVLLTLPLTNVLCSSQASLVAASMARMPLPSTASLIAVHSGSDTFAYSISPSGALSQVHESVKVC